MSETLKIAHIPSLTWNRLGVNETLVEGDLALTGDVDTRFETLPDGVTSRTLSPEEAKAFLAEHAPKEAPEAVVAGKVPIYHPQTFGTGLGADFDAYLAQGVKEVTLLETADNLTLTEPIRWDIECREGNHVAGSELIHVGRNSSLTLILCVHSDEKASGVFGNSTKVILEDGATLTLAKVQMLGSGFTDFEDTGAALKDNAHLDVIQLSLGGKASYLGCQSELNGKGSTMEAHTGYIAGRDQTVDVNYNTIQRGQKTDCQMHFDGVLDHNGQKTFRGTIDFRKGAKGSTGDEQENVLLLSEDPLNRTLPIILCEEEDVEGRHGASIGRLEDDMLFYLATRGISECQAQEIMVRARLSAITRLIPDETLQIDIRDFIEDAFRKKTLS